MNKRTALMVLAIAGGVNLAVGDQWLTHQVCKLCRLGSPWLQSASDITKIVQSLDAEKRDNYVVFLWTFDLVGPLLYGGFFYLGTSLGVAKAWPGAPFAARLRWISVAAAVSDYLENVLTTVLLVSHPEEVGLLARACASATMIKWALYAAAAASWVSARAAIVIRGPHRDAGTPRA